MPVSMGAKGQADFTQPIELMMDCHRRIENFLEVLQRVVKRYGRDQLDDEGRAALETALNYFAQAAPRHTADEEESLFPRMRQCSQAQVRQAMAEIDTLESDHRKAEAAHARVDEVGRAWLESGRLDARDRDELEALLTDMTATYARHIRIEDQQIFVLAAQTLEAQELQQVGREMKERRA